MIELRKVKLTSELENTEKAYSKLKDAGWEEKFYTEQISRRAIKEELALANQRHKDKLVTLKLAQGELADQNARLEHSLRALPETEKMKMSGYTSGV